MKQPLFTRLAGALFLGALVGAHAQTYPPPAPLSPRAQYDLDRQDAAARYQQDQKLCDDGLSAASRMQCKRDAKAEYDNAIATAKAHLAAASQPAPVQAPVYAPPPAYAPPAYGPATAAAPVVVAPAEPVAPGYTEPAPAIAQPAALLPPMQPACTDCGRVTNVFTTQKKPQGSALGVIAGAVAGGVLGHQIGGGVGKNVATIAGAAGGAFAGNAIGKNASAQTVWVVSVSYPNGAVANYEFPNAPVFKAGDFVRASGQTIVYP